MTGDEWIRLVVVFVVAFGFGFASRLGVARALGREVKLPYIDQSKRSMTLIAVAVLVVSFGGMAQGVYYNQNQENCNAETRRVLADNGDVNSAQRTIDNQREALLDADRNATRNLVKSLTQPLNNQQRIRLVEEFDAEQQRISDADTQLKEDRRALDGARSPYPLPRCD